jgi:M6 family metalloprotease-like protein
VKLLENDWQSMNTNFAFFCRTLTLTLLLVLVSLPGMGADGPGPAAFRRSGQELSPRLQDLLDHRTLAVRDDGSSGLQRKRVAGEKAPASLDAILLMCDFSDSLMLGRYGLVPGDFPPPMQTEIYYDAHDSVFFDHLLGDVADYFEDVSGGAFTFNYTIHPRVVNLPHPMAFYGNHPEEGEQPLVMAAGVVDSLDAEIDFSLYDTVLLVHAGAGEETDILGDSPEQIYSTYLDPGDFQAAFEDSLLEQPYLPTGDHPEGEGIDQVLVLPETEYQDLVQGFGGYFGSLGVYCFEVGLRLGMLSLSDFTPAGRPDSQGIGEFGLMGYGLFVGMGWIPPHPCAYNKYLMGWLDPLEVDPSTPAGHFLLPCEQTAGPHAAIRVDITGQEYWLLAYRQQDPDGNRIFSHPGDLNGNNIPDFYDADSVFGDGTPTSYFDPATDTRERLLGCEWDFFMSENSARHPYDKGAGSGVYVWHIDEGVVRWAFDQPSNLFNANPQRKSVDLEEADGIQDLDSKIPSAWQLGGDDDSFRGEDQASFGPFTRPDTRSNGGAFTGIRFADFSPVVRDSAAFISYIVYDEAGIAPVDTVMGFVYADTVTFRLENIAAAEGPRLAARRDLPEGMDLRGSHLLLADLDGDGSDEIVAAGAAGEILVLDGDLNEFLDHDGDSATMEPFAIGTLAGQPVAWNQPPAVGNIDDDPEPEIVLTGPGGVFAFNGDGTPVRDLGPGNHGLYAGLGDCSLPPVLLPVARDSLYSAAEPVQICAVTAENGNTALQLFAGGDAQVYRRFELGAVMVSSPPVLAWGQLALATLDTVDMAGWLHLIDPDQTSVPEPPHGSAFELGLAPGPQPVMTGLVDPGRPEATDRFAAVLGHGGQAVTVLFDSEGRRVLDNIHWNAGSYVATGLAPGGAMVGDGVLGRLGHNGEWIEGWPVRPLLPVEPADQLCGSSPLVCRLTGSDLTLEQYLFPVLDGGLLAFGTRGEPIAGWPLAGPASSAGTPALGQVGGEPDLELVAAGAFERITGLGPEGADLTGSWVSTLMVWSDVAQPGAVWPMWGASPWRNGGWNMTGWVSPPGAASGSGIVAGSHKCYPSPLREGPLRVRASSRDQGRARAEIYDLTGELVQASQWQPVAAREPFAIVMDLDDVVSGMYLCRLTVESRAGDTDHSVISVAVVR